MKKIAIMVSALILSVLCISCNKEQSLQSYLVESQDKPGFMSIDVPLSFIQLKTGDITDDNCLNHLIKSIKPLLLNLPHKVL